MDGRKDANNFNSTVLNDINLDIICESFLKDNKMLCLNGYRWYENNRANLHKTPGVVPLG